MYIYMCVYIYIYIYIYIGGTQLLKLVNNATLQRTVNAANANRITDYERCKRLPECTFYFIRHKSHIGVLVTSLETSDHVSAPVTTLQTGGPICVL